MIRVGICFVPFGTTYAQLKEAALTAEDAGFESVWTYDHLISFNSVLEEVLECWSVLAALAEATSRVKLGSFVANVMSRSPDLVAKMVATIQEISGGRVELGIGAGARPKEQLAFGRPFPGGRERVERVGEAVELMRLLWTGKATNYDGRYYKASDSYCAPAPDPIPPVMVAGGGPRSTRNAVKVGDGWNCDGSFGWNGDNSKFYRLREIVLEELKRVGKPRESFEVSISEKLDDAFLRDPRGHIAQAQEEGIDRVVLDMEPPFDTKVIASLGKKLYG